MNTYIGIDLGTSSAKFLLVDESGNILSSHTEQYAVRYPQSGWSEQNPRDWFAAADRGMPLLLKGFNGKDVRGISFGGQMHGLVVLDKNDNVIRPCILWNDGRTEKQTAYLNEAVGKDKLSAYTANIAFAGFTAPKLLWLKENEPDNFNAIAKIMLPKDYLCYLFTGEHATDYSDAAGTLLLDVENMRWSGDMLRLCGINKTVLPRLCKSYEKVGALNGNLARRWGLGDGVTVAGGGGDNAAAAVGTGTVSEGACSISLGTSGTVFIARDKFATDGQNALHSFCHANGKWHLMGCILSAASCNGWWMNVLGAEDFTAEQSGPSSGGVYFMPYLMGERSPHNDVNAKGAFIGLRPDTTRGQMTRAVLEGVAFALRDCVEAAKRSGAKISSARICGGGAKSLIWRQIIADVLNIPVEIPATVEGPAYGAAMLAMVACGVFGSVEEAAEKLVRVAGTVSPSPQSVRDYDTKYTVYKRLYPALKGVFADM